MLNLTQEFPIIDHTIYLNHAAVSPRPRRTAEAGQRFSTENMVNGAKNYSQWEQQEQLLREQLRILVNAPVVTDIALLKNTSEALSLVAYGLTWQKNDNIVIPNRLNRRLTQISPISPLSVFQIGVDTLITPLDSAAKSAWDKVDCRKQG